MRNVNGRGRFRPTDWIPEYAVPEFPRDVAVDDFDQDGDPDLIIVCAEFDGFSMPDVLLLNDGTGHMTIGPLTLWDASSAVDTDDIDGDSYPDIYVASTFNCEDHCPPDEDSLLHNALPRPFEFLPPPPVPEPESSSDVILADFTGNGVADILVASVSPRGVHLFVNDGTGNFSEASETNLPHDSTSLTPQRFDAGDIDGDGDLDVVGGVSEPSTLNQLWINDGAGLFSAVPDAFPANEWNLNLALFDADGDSDLDLLDVGEKDLLYLNDGNGSFSQGGSLPPRVGGWVADIAAGDVDGDGDMDLLLGVHGYDRLWINDGSGSFVQAN